MPVRYLDDAPQPTANTPGVRYIDDPEWERGTVLPFAMNQQTGERRLAMPQVVEDTLQSAKSAATLPGDVYTGNKPLDKVTPKDTLNFGLWASPVSPITKGRVSPKAVERLSGAQFQKFRQSGGFVKADAFRDWAAKTHSALAKKYSSSSDVGAGALLDELAGVEKYITKTGKREFVRPGDLHDFRKVLGGLAGNYKNGTNQSASVAAMDQLDSWFLGGQNHFINPAKGAAAQKLFSDAKGNYAAAKRTLALQGKIDDAELGAAAANSGKNVGNATRQRVKSMLTSNAYKQRRGFSPEELRNMDQFVRGTPATNLMRGASNRMAGGGGMATANAGAFGGGVAGLGAHALGLDPWSAALAGAVVTPAVGAGLKGGENALAQHGASKLARNTLNRAPALAGKNPALGARDLSAELAARALAMQQMWDAQGPQYFDTPQPAPNGAELPPEQRMQWLMGGLT